MVDENLDFSLDETQKVNSLESSFTLIDQIYPFKKLFNETK